jgi:hypothetical protein
MKPTALFDGRSEPRQAVVPQPARLFPRNQIEASDNAAQADPVPMLQFR